VKLRSGGVVDSDDLSQGWLVSRILRGRENSVMEDPEHFAVDSDDEGPPPPQKSGKWGPRGISVSADDPVDETASQTTPVEASGVRKDDADEVDEADDSLPVRAHANEGEDGIGNGTEWTDDAR
jgi:hypothetical protein